MPVLSKNLPRERETLFVLIYVLCMSLSKYTNTHTMYKNVVLVLHIDGAVKDYSPITMTCPLVLSSIVTLYPAAAFLNGPYGVR